jgi:hypothetical protein
MEPVTVLILPVNPLLGHIVAQAAAIREARSSLDRAVSAVGQLPIRGTVHPQPNVRIYIYL